MVAAYPRLVELGQGDPDTVTKLEVKYDGRHLDTKNSPLLASPEAGDGRRQAHHRGNAQGKLSSINPKGELIAFQGINSGFLK